MFFALLFGYLFGSVDCEWGAAKNSCLPYQGSKASAGV